MKRGWTKFLAGPSPVGKVPGAIACWHNSRYVVLQCHPQATEWGDVTRLMVRRNDNNPTVPWSDLQRVKNEIMGEDRVAIQVHPPVDELVDDAHIFHLWVLPEGFCLPFGLKV
jgi:hypothetical protein